MAHIIKANSTKIDFTGTVPVNGKQTVVLTAELTQKATDSIKIEIRNSANKKIKIIQPYPDGFSIKPDTIAVLTGKISLSNSEKVSIQGLIFKNENTSGNEGTSYIKLIVINKNGLNSEDNTFISFS